MNKFQFLIPVFLIYCLTACHSKKDSPNYKLSHREMEKIESQINLNILRYDQDIFTLDTANIQKSIQALSQKYPEFLIEKNAYKNQELIHYFKLFITDKNTLEIYKESQKTFANTDSLTEKLKIAFAYYKHYYPEVSIPTIITMISGLDMETPSVFLYQNYLVINLDMYMGNQCKIYQKAGIPIYISQRMDAKYLLQHLFSKALIYEHLPKYLKNTFLDYLIYEGKKLYFTQMMMPETPPEDIIEYSSEQYKWIEKNIANLWVYYTDNNWLYSTDKEFISKTINDAPFTKPFGQNCPGRAGAYIGWQIIKDYMKNNPDISLNDMLQETDAQKILKLSKFKPKI